jgi:carboxypeptidase C (cathepsin A)
VQASPKTCFWLWVISVTSLSRLRVRKFCKFIFHFYSDNDFYIFGESYAGKYIPQLSHYILQQKDTQIPLKGIGIGDGFSDPLSQSQSYADFVSSYFSTVFSYFSLIHSKR